eukprot:TRINITY_DN677_c0_g1_i15.p1 TRINITY_DN677_c0_g1~~TRINITY_DN677_c0_g1_i15.p1  ORF type:complete len:589 (-),score=86.58 TRINITY_DN677_c0_g1_i15:141-1850(-)
MKLLSFTVGCSIVLFAGVCCQGNSGNNGKNTAAPTAAPTSGGNSPTLAPTPAPTDAPTSKPGGGNSKKTPAPTAAGNSPTPAPTIAPTSDGLVNETDENNTEINLDSRTLVHVQGQSGKFTVYNSQQGKSQGITINMDALREVDALGNTVGATGPKNEKHSFNSFATQQFTIEDAEAVVVGNVEATLIKFHSPINTIGKIQVDTYVMAGAGLVGPPGEKWAVANGDLKWNIKLYEWTFCGCNKGTEVGAYVDLDVSMKGPRSASFKQGSKSISMGDGVNLELSNQVLVDGVWMAMPTGYPMVTVKGSSTTFTFRFPKFNTSATYDPLISGMSPATSAPTPALTAAPTPALTAAPTPTSSPAPTPAPTAEEPSTPAPTLPKGPGATPSPTVVGATPMPTIPAEQRDQVAGSFEMKVADPAAFVQNEANKAPIAGGIAKAVNVTKDDVKVTLRLKSRRLAETSSSRRMADGAIVVEYIIFLPEDFDAAGTEAIKSALQATDVVDKLAKLINDEAGGAFTVEVTSSPSVTIREGTKKPVNEEEDYAFRYPAALAWTSLSLAVSSCVGSYLTV